MFQYLVIGEIINALIHIVTKPNKCNNSWSPYVNNTIHSLPTNNQIKLTAIKVIVPLLAYVKECGRKECKCDKTA